MYCMMLARKQTCGGGDDDGEDQVLFAVIGSTSILEGWACLRLGMVLYIR